jgi:hypothetical protein
MKKSISRIGIIVALLLAPCLIVHSQPVPSGPGGVWIRTTAPTGTRAILVDGDRLYIGGDFGTLYSKDRGDTWTPTGQHLVRGWSLIFRDGVLFAATPDSGVFRSTDSGTTWFAVNSGMTHHFVTTLYLDGAKLYAGTLSKGIFRWADAGMKWTPLGDTTVLPGPVSFSRIGSELYACGYGEVMRSSDDGDSWAKVDRGNLPICPIFQLVKAGPNLVAATGNGVYYSPFDWNNWSPTRPSAGWSGWILQIGSYLFATACKHIYVSDQNGAYGRDLIGGGCWAIQPMVSDGAYVYIVTDYGMDRRPLAEVVCCQGTRGNTDGTGIVDSADLSLLVSYLTGAGVTFPCQELANINGTGLVDSADLSALVSYLTGGGFTLPLCQSSQ